MTMTVMEMVVFHSRRDEFLNQTLTTTSCRLSCFLDVTFVINQIRRRRFRSYLLLYLSESDRSTARRLDQTATEPTALELKRYVQKRIFSSSGSSNSSCIEIRELSS